MKINHPLLCALLCFLLFAVNDVIAQVEQFSEGCNTPNLDSLNAMALPYYGNNQVIESYLIQNGYNNLQYISFPGIPFAKSSLTTFLEPNFLIPLNIYIYRDGGNNPGSSITEAEARDYVCRVNELYRDSGTGIQFYANRVESSANNFYNQEQSTLLHMYDMWSAKRYIPDNSKGINVHFIRYNNSPQSSEGIASLPHYPVAPYTQYSLAVRTHSNTAGVQFGPVRISSTLAHELGHTLGLLHTHHPGRYASLLFNADNANVTNGCYQESVSRSKKNYWYNGCFGTDDKLKCEINGDFLCDTDADPNQSGLVNNNGCVYEHPASGNYRVDNWNDMWAPPTNNVMSYTTDDCRNQFSRSQIGIMWMQMPHLKQFINYQQPVIASSSNNVCYSSSTTFSLSGTLPNDAAVTWEVQPAYLVATSQGSGVANLNAASSSTSGTADIIFTIVGSGNCYIARLKKQISIGVPSGPGGISGPSVVNDGSLYTFSIKATKNTQSYNWTWPSGWSAPSTTTAPSAFVQPFSNSGYVTVTPSNTCGYASSSSKYVTLNVCQNCLMFVSPNPATDIVTIGYREDASKATTAVTQYIIHDSYGAIISKGSFSESQKSLDLSHVKTGAYIITVHLKNGYKEKHRVIIGK